MSGEFNFTLHGGTDHDGNQVDAIVKYYTCGSNPEPHLSITGEVWEKGTPYPRPKSERHLISCGCVHSKVAEAYPQLAPFIAWHLTSPSGPMHYTDNAVYHVQNALGLYRVFSHSEWEKPDSKAWEHFASTVALGALLGDPSLESLRQKWERIYAAERNWATPIDKRAERCRKVVARWCELRRDRLRRAFAEALADLRAMAIDA